MDSATASNDSQKTCLETTQPRLCSDAESRKFTIGWIAPTPVEYEAAHAAMAVDDQNHHPQRRKIFRPGNDSYYLEGKIGHQWVVAACQGRFGQLEASRTASRMHHSFQCIKEFVVVGIAGGAFEYFNGTTNPRQQIVLGDVVISSQKPNPDLPAIALCDQGTSTRGDFKHSYYGCKEPDERLQNALNEFRVATPTDTTTLPMQLQAELIMAVQAQFRRMKENPLLAVDPGSDKDVLIDCDFDHPYHTLPCQDSCMDRGVFRSKRGETAQRVANSPFVHMGSVASYNSFRADPKKRDAKMEEGFLCFEMEAAGAAKYLPTLTVRGIMDYADSHRTYASEWRNYAAITAAAVARQVIACIPPSSPSDGKSSKDAARLATPHHLADMPPLCQPYQAQIGIDNRIRKFLFPVVQGQTQTLLLYGLAGRGKTQACVSIIREIEKNSSSRWSRLLWVTAHSSSALSDSLQKLHQKPGVRNHGPSSLGSTQPGDTTESICNDIQDWLSVQEQPWLMVLDHLNIKDDSGVFSEEKMLHWLDRTKNGRIIVTARRIPDQWPRDEAEHVNAMDQDSALKLFQSHLRRGPLCAEETEAARMLIRHLDCLPIGISIACATIKNGGYKVKGYVGKWQEKTFDPLPESRWTGKPKESLNVALKFAYEALSRETTDIGNLLPVDLLKILSCLNGSHISETIFQRAWEAWRSTSSSGQSNTSKNESQAETVWDRIVEFISSSLGSHIQSKVSEQKQTRPIFLVDGPEEQWHDSKARTQLRSALRKLANFSLLTISEDLDNCEIMVSPVVQAWICFHPYASGLLQAEELRQAWRHALSTLAASLPPGSPSCSTDPKTCLTLHKPTAAHMIQLEHLSADLDKTENSEIGRANPGCSWTKNVLSVEKEEGVTGHFADCLDLHCFPKSAMLLREAYESLWGSSTYDSIEELARRLVYADTLTQNGLHLRALNRRKEAMASLHDLQITVSETCVSLSSQPILHKLLELFIQRDIADSYWELGEWAAASEMLEKVLVGFRAVEAKHLALEGPLFAHSVFRDFRMLASMERARCLGLHQRRFKDAEDLLDEVLTDRAAGPQNDIHIRHRQRRARSIRADIMSAQGQLLAAHQEKGKIHQEWLEEDPEVVHLNTMMAQHEYANSLSEFGEHEQALVLRQKIERRLCEPENHVPPKHEIFCVSRQSLAKCYMECANSHPLNKKTGHYHGDVQDYILSAARHARWVWTTRRESEGLGPTHLSTLSSLALMVKFESLAMSGRGGGKLPWGRGIQDAVEKTKDAISPALLQKEPLIRRAWFQVQLDAGFGADSETKEKLLRYHENQLGLDPEDPTAKEMKLEVRYQIANARMEPLLHCEDKKQKKNLRKERRFREAAQELEEVWKVRQEQLGKESSVSLAALTKAAEAFRQIEDDHYMDLQKQLCISLYSEHGKGNQRAGRALEELNRYRSMRRQAKLGVEDLR